MLIQTWIKVMHCSLFCLTLHIRVGDQYLPSIHSWDRGPCQVLYIHLFLSFYLFIYLSNFFSATVVLNCLLCCACISKMRINLTIFLFKRKFISFQICDFAHLLSHYQYFQNYFFLFQLIIFIFYIFYFAIISYFHCFVMLRYH